MTAFNRAVEGLKDVPELRYSPARVREAIARNFLRSIREPDEAVCRASGMFGTQRPAQTFTAMIDAILQGSEAEPAHPTMKPVQFIPLAGTIDTETGEITDREYPTGGRFRFSVAPDVTFSARADYTALGDYGSSPLDETDPTGEEG